VLPPFTTGKTLDEEQHLREKARLLLQREREHTELLQKYERLAVWLGLGQALPALFLDRKSTPQQRWDRVRKMLISRVRVQRVLVVEVAAGELRPVSPAGAAQPLPPDARALLDASSSGFCNDPESEQERHVQALAHALGLHCFMWSRIAPSVGSELLIVAGFDRTKASFQSPFVEQDAAFFTNATQHIESLAANAMLVAELESETRQLQEANATLEKRDHELREAARELLEANESLERRVRERTRELAGKNRELRLVLDNVDQALVTIDLDGRLAVERSSVVERWFGAADKSLFLDYVCADQRFSSLFNLGLSALRDDVLPREICIHQLPRQLVLHERFFECRYLPIEQGPQLSALLLVIDDVTERRARERADAEQSELLAAFTGLMQDRAGFAAFVHETERALEQLSEPTCRALTQSQLLHTLKGNSATLGLRVIAEQCHAAESELNEAGVIRAETLAGIRARWAAVTRTVSAVAPTSLDRVIEVTDPELARLAGRAEKGASAREVVEELRRLGREPVARCLERLAKHSQALVARLERPPLLIDVTADDIRLDATVWAKLWSALVHAVRNAVDHGVELPEERVASGKPRQGRLGFSAHRVGDGFRLRIRDDGRGVDWAGVRRMCQDRGWPSGSRAELVAALLAPGFSTRAQVTENSGRGVGLSALAEVVRELGGALQLESEPGQGTCLSLSLPDPHQA
jgi:HPt (histidine-containing phosphotransfer) domain-containing protein